MEVDNGLDGVVQFILEGDEGFVPPGVDPLTFRIPILDRHGDTCSNLDPFGVDECVELDDRCGT